MRVCELGAKNTWRNVRDEMGRLHVGSFAGPASKVTQRTELTVRQKEILKALKVTEPPRLLGIAPAEGYRHYTRSRFTRHFPCSAP